MLAFRKILSRFLDTVRQFSTDLLHIFSCTNFDHYFWVKLEGGEIEYNMIDGEVLLTQLTIDWDYIKKKQKEKGMGLYTIRNSELEGFSAKPAKKITTVHAAVNGMAANIKDTIDFMPNFINYGYPKTRLNSDSEHTLFYNDYNGFLNADWKCMLDSSGLSGGTPAAKKLAAVIEIAAREKRSVNWTIHERGCAIFKQALRLVNTSSQYDYSTQTVFYANPLVDAGLIDKHRERLGMALSEKGILANGFSLHQGLVAGNWTSEPRLIWKAGNKGLATVKAGVRVAKIAAVVNPIVTTAIVLPALTGAAPWAMALLTLTGHEFIRTIQ